MDEKLRIAVCEDTKAEEDKLLSILKDASIANEVSTFHSAEELLAIYKPDAFDLLLMDIYMDGMSGVEAVSKIREIDEKVPVAFITTSTDFALESYRLSALKYIEKPYKEKAVYDILKLAKLQKDTVPKLTYKRGGKTESIPLSQLLYIEMQTRQLALYLKSGEIIHVYEKLAELMRRLPSDTFCSFHKSYCVHLCEVDYIDDELKCFIMSNGDTVPIRRENLSSAKKTLANYLFERTREAGK